MMGNGFPWVEIVDPIPEQTFTKEQVIERMVEVFGDRLVNFEQYPRIAKHQFLMTKFLMKLESQNTAP